MYKVGNIYFIAATAVIGMFLSSLCRLYYSPPFRESCC